MEISPVPWGMHLYTIMVRIWNFDQVTSTNLRVMQKHIISSSVNSCNLYLPFTQCLFCSKSVVLSASQILHNLINQLNWNSKSCESQITEINLKNMKSKIICLRIHSYIELNWDLKPNVVICFYWLCSVFSTIVQANAVCK